MSGAARLPALLSPDNTRSTQPGLGREVSFAASAAEVIVLGEEESEESQTEDTEQQDRSDGKDDKDDDEDDASPSAHFWPVRSQATMTRTKSMAHSDLFSELGALMPYSMLASFFAGVTMPVVNFMLLNIFAARFSGQPAQSVHCEASTLEEHCKAAVLKLNDVSAVLALARPLVDIALAPAVAGFSDTVGRRTMVIGYQVASLLPVVALCLAVSGRADVHVNLILGALVTDNLIYAVMSAAVIDRITHAHSRASAMGLVTAANTLAHIAGLVSGFSLSLEASFMVWVVSSVAMVLVAFLVFPETLPMQNRRPLVLRKMLPVASMSILWRNRFLVRLTWIMAAITIADSGFERVFPSFVQRRMEWSMQTSYLYFIVIDFSAVLWLGFGLKPLTDYLGETGALAVGRLACLFGFSALYLSQNPAQVLILGGIFAGPMSFAMPAISSLKSRMVSDGEQGAMQGALGALVSVATSFGSLFNGAIFSYLSRVQDDEGVARSMTMLTIAVAFPTLYLICDMWYQTRILEEKGQDWTRRMRHQSLLIEEEEEIAEVVAKLSAGRSVT